MVDITAHNPIDIEMLWPEYFSVSQCRSNPNYSLNKVDRAMIPISKNTQWCHSAFGKTGQGLICLNHDYLAVPVLIRPRRSVLARRRHLSAIINALELLPLN